MVLRSMFRRYYLGFYILNDKDNIDWIRGFLLLSNSAEYTIMP
jgi:hypothetical protein